MADVAVTAQAPNQPTTGPGSDFLSVHLNMMLKEWVESRKPQEEEFRQNYMDRLRIARQGDTLGTGTATSKKAKPLFMGLTRSKIRTARARIKDTLFGQGRLPFDTTPKNEQFKAHAHAFEKILRLQFKAMKYKREIGGGVNALCTYGTGFMAGGPFVREATITTTNRVETNGAFAITEEAHSYLEPFYEHARTINVYPDPEAKDVQEGQGVFWFTLKTASKIKKRLRDDRFRFIEVALRDRASFQRGDHGQTLLEDARANIQYFTKDGRISDIHFFGLLPRRAVKAWQDGTLEPFTIDITDPDSEFVESIAIITGGIVTRVFVSPFKERPLRRAVYEEEEGEMYGVGIARNNEPNQRVINAAFRLFMESKGFALLGLWDVDRSKFKTTEKFNLFPGKVFERAEGVTTAEAEQALRQITFEDVSGGWVEAIGLAEKFSDDDTGINKSSAGTQDPNILRAPATAIALLQGAGTIPLKEVMINMDEGWLEHHVTDLIEWDLEFLEVETVRLLHDDETAQLWDEIKKFGRASFMTWRPTGSSTFVQKEILSQKLQAFLSLAASTPQGQTAVDIRDLYDQIWENLETGTDSPVFDEATVMERQAQAVQAAEPERRLSMAAMMAKAAKDKASATKDTAQARTMTRTETRKELEARAEGGQLSAIEALLREIISRLPPEAQAAGGQTTRTAQRQRRPRGQPRART